MASSPFIALGIPGGNIPEPQTGTDAKQESSQHGDRFGIALDKNSLWE